MNPKRRSFLKQGTVLGTGLLLGQTNASDAGEPTPPRPSKARYLGGFAAPKLDTVRLAFIGVGARGAPHVRQLATIEGTEVVAICDLYDDLVRASMDKAKQAGNGRHQDIQPYSGDASEWKRMLREQQPDAVIISTPWKDHAPMAIESMRQGAHAFVEVPMALTLDELWAVIDTAETTRKHCMMMENVNYGRDELLFLNMTRQGVLGELLHGEAAYIHELRFQMKQEQRGTGSWRTYQYAKRDGNLYPTHGLGPVAQYMNLARGEDNFHRINSFSSPARGRALYARKHFPADHKWNQLDYRGGDINTSIIKTTLGRTIMIQWDETSPRPYSRHNLIQGTNGVLAGFPTRIALDGGVEGISKDHHSWVRGRKLEAIYEKYEHPLYKRLGTLARKMGGHGGMDFMMLYRMVECLREGAPLDQNIYEGCFWSAVSELSERSVAQHGAPQTFPDFTRGAWRDTAPLDIIA